MTTTQPPDCSTGGAGLVAARRVLRCRGTGDLGTVSAVLVNPIEFESFGTAISEGRDVDGDGIADVLVGAEGHAYLYLGGEGGLSTEPWVTLVEGEEYGKFGRSVAIAGDVNGDGHADLLVGDYNADLDDGRAYVYLGAVDGVTASTPVDGWDRAFLGYSVAGLGDADGDGYDDVVIGAPYGEDGGVAVVFTGSTVGLAGTAAVTLSEGGSSGDFGEVVTGAGDVDADGYPDLLVSAPEAGAGGEVYLYRGGVEDVDLDGYPSPDDCDDADAAVHPDAVEVCNGQDDDCSGEADDGATDASSWYPDADADGWSGSAGPRAACEAPDGYIAATDPADCNDSDPGVSPGATEVPGDGVDQDCDGADAGSDAGREAKAATSCGCASPGGGASFAAAWAAGCVVLARRRSFRHTLGAPPARPGVRQWVRSTPRARADASA